MSQLSHQGSLKFAASFSAVTLGYPLTPLAAATVSRRAAGDLLDTAPDESAEGLQPLAGDFDDVWLGVPSRLAAPPADAPFPQAVFESLWAAGFRAFKVTLKLYRADARWLGAEADRRAVELFTDAALAWVDEQYDSGPRVPPQLSADWRATSPTGLMLGQQIRDPLRFRGVCAEVTVASSYAAFRKAMAARGIPSPANFHSWFRGHEGYGVGWWNRTHRCFRQALQASAGLRREWCDDALAEIAASVDDLRRLSAGTSGRRMMVDLAILRLLRAEGMLELLLEDELSSADLQAMRVHLELATDLRQGVSMVTGGHATGEAEDATSSSADNFLAPIPEASQRASMSARAAGAHCRKPDA
jgi:hypothetical protein